MRRLTFRFTVADYLMSLSRFGGTKLERLTDGAAEQANIHFDAAQVPVNLPNGHYTVIDRVIYHPPTAIYIDGWQHDVREYTGFRDQTQNEGLRAMGWKVVRLGWRELIQDPQSAVLRVIYGQ